jgi:hypothetical protein
MALGDLYVTRAELKTRLGLTSTTDDPRIDDAVAAASRDVEQFCNRQFNKVASATTRKFLAESKTEVFTDDFYKLDDLAVSVVSYSGGSSTTTVLDSGEVRAEPLERNRYGFSQEAPYWSLLNLSTTDWPLRDAGHIEVTAHWGWASVPTTVKEATYILAVEYFKLKDAPFGVVNWGEFGPVRVQENKVVLRMLKQYARGKVKVA